MQVNRSENKYLITQVQAACIKKRLQNVIPLDVHCTSMQGYEIRSLYFDTVKNRSCYEKLEGYRIHEKIRLRIYGHDDHIIKLESKWKDGMRQVKKSLLISRSLANELILGKYEGLKDFDDPLSMYFYKRLSEGMVPKAIITYDRLSYCLNTNNTRITFDSNIRSTESNFNLFLERLETHPILPASHVILEVKFNGFLLDYIKRELEGLKQSVTSYSKYVNGRMFY